MRYRVLVLAILTGLGVAACNENGSPGGGAPSGAGGLAQNGAVAGKSGEPVQRKAGAPIGAAPPRLAPGQPAKGASFDAAASLPVISDDPIPPVDAQWSIFCYSVGGVTHVEDSKNLKAKLIQKTNRRDWYVIHRSDESHLYFGYYRTINEALNAKDQQEIVRARADKDLVQNIEDARLDKPFRASAFVQLSAPDPTSRPEWNLANVDLIKAPKDPTRAYWSIQVAAFRDNPKRKEAAVQAVQGLREHNIEAYYYHGESVSSVCVGAWPPDAVREAVANPEMRDVAAVDPRKADLLVVTSEPLPETMVPKKQQGANKVTAVVPQLNIVDKGMLAMTKKFPHHQVNYEEKHHKRKLGGTVVEPSFLVVIPRAKGNGLYDSDDVESRIRTARPQQQPRQHEVPSAFVNPTTPGNASPREFGALDGTTLDGTRLTDPAAAVRQPAPARAPVPAPPPGAPEPGAQPQPQPAAPPPAVPGAGRLRRGGEK